MSAALRVIRAGPLTTVQDRGRTGHAGLGLPPGGALDREALAVANRLVGAADDAAVLEATAHGPVLQAVGGRVRLAVAGADCAPRLQPGGGRTPRHLRVARSVVLEEGERLDVGALRGSLRCCIAVAGGIDVPPVLGSRSTHVASGIGGLRGRALRDGDVVPVGAVDDPGEDRVLDDPPTTLVGSVRVVVGPDVDALDAASLQRLLATPVSVGHRSDRAALALDTPSAPRPATASDLPHGCVPGSVQVTPAGGILVLLADGGTTGGYARPLTVISADLPRLARLRPGQTLRLELVDREQAVRLRRQADADLAAVLARIGPADPDA